MGGSIYLVSSISKFNKPWKLWLPTDTLKIIKKITKMPTDAQIQFPHACPSSSRTLGTWRHLVCTELIKKHQWKHISSVDIIFFFNIQWLSLPTEKKKSTQKREKKMKSKVFISKPYWFFFIYKTRPCLSIKNRMSKGLNLCPAKNPNFLLTSRQASQLEQKQKRPRKG